MVRTHCFLITLEMLLTIDPLENYLRDRTGSKFNRHDFDCLSNKFVSRLVIRAN